MALFGNRNTLREIREEQQEQQQSKPNRRAMYFTIKHRLDAAYAEIKQLRQENKKLKEEVKELKRQLKIWNDPTYPRSGMW